jgi:hypothetical protein
MKPFVKSTCEPGLPSCSQGPDLVIVCVPAVDVCPTDPRTPQPVPVDGQITAALMVVAVVLIGARALWRRS